MKSILLICIIFLCMISVEPHTDVYAKKNEQIELIGWKEVNKILPKYSTFTVVDVETGVKFRVQRRAGSNHADVQPLTKEDTKKMKEVYSGKWSWKRRAIVVLAENRKIAASMHGMPHGAGALKNNFPGHFCIHFYGSTTHRTNFMDLSHKLMILKAAGKLDGYVEKANPYDLLSIHMAGIKQNDKNILMLTSVQQIEWEKIFQSVENVDLGQMHVLPPEDLEDELGMSVPVEVDFFIKNKGKRRFRGQIQMFRSMPYGQWSIDSEGLLTELGLIK